MDPPFLGEASSAGYPKQRCQCGAVALEQRREALLILQVRSTLEQNEQGFWRSAFDTNFSTQSSIQVERFEGW